MSFYSEPAFEWGVLIAIFVASALATLVFSFITRNEKME
jgi:hypothetical protein